MATELDFLPRLNDLSDLMMTKDEMNEMREAAFIRMIEDKKIKLVMNDNKIACVVIAPELHNGFVEALDTLSAAKKASSALSGA